MSFKSLLPVNATKLERALERAIFDNTKDRSAVRQLWDPYQCPPEFLPWLAWAVGVEEWNTNWPEATKREVIAATPDIRRHRGTVWAVRRALTAAGYADAQIEEGLPTLRHDGTSYHNGINDYSAGTRWAIFRVVADIGENIGIDTEERNRLARLVEMAKPVRSVMRDIRYRASMNDALTTEDDLDVQPHVGFADLRPAGLRHNGQIRHNQATPLPPLPLHHDRAIRYDATARHTGLLPQMGWHVTGHRHNNVWDRLYLIVVDQSMKDDFSAPITYNATGVHDGQLAHNGVRAAPVDTADLIIRRDIQHNGNRRYGGRWMHRATAVERQTI